MSWGLITDEWRLKLLALGLAVLMLGAVAFSQNPPTTLSATVNVVYTPSQNTVLINSPNQIKIYYSGLADVIQRVNATNTVAKVDASHAGPGTAVRLPVDVSSTISGVSFQEPAPIVVRIDNHKGKDLPVTVNWRAAPGWSVNEARTFGECPPKPNPCTVHFDGPESWETNLAAIVTLPGPVNYTTGEIPNLQVQLQNANGVLDLTCKTIPCATLDVVAVSVHVEASPGSTVSSVPLVAAPWSHPPASGYRVTSETITPNTVVISGDAVALGRIRFIVLPPVDLSGKTKDYTAQAAIPYPDGVTGNVATATVTYSIGPNPNVSPGP